MKTTQEYFQMSLDELLTINKESGWTREECKIYDDGIKVTFFDFIEEYEREKKEYEEWIKNYDSDLELKAELLTINGRVAVIYI